MWKEKGQAMVEYIFLLLLVASVATGIYNRVKKLVDEQNGGVFLTPFLLLESEEPQQRYKNFRIIR